MFKNKRTVTVGVLMVAFFLSLLTLMNLGKALAVDAFLKIDGIKGESTDSKHKDEIELISWSFGETNSGAAQVGGGGGAGKVNMQDFKFTMRTNKASPPLFGACATGKHIKEAKLVVRRSDQTKAEFFQIWLTDVLVSSFVNLGSSGGTDALPMEEIMLNFSKIEITYSEIDPRTGGKKGDIKFNWDVKQNKGG